MVNKIEEINEHGPSCIPQPHLFVYSNHFPTMEVTDLETFLFLVCFSNEVKR